MIELKVKRMIWAKPGTVKTNGSKQELKRTSAGVYHRMRNNGEWMLKIVELKCILMRLDSMYSNKL